MRIKRQLLGSYRKLVAHPNPWLRRSIGFALVIGGILGPVLPVLGLWMLPLGIILLTVDIKRLKPMRRRYNGWWRKKLAERKQNRAESDTRPPDSRP